MSPKQQRYSIKSKEARLVIREISERLKINIEDTIGSKPKFEIVELDSGKIYLLNGRPIFYRFEDKILPTLLFTELYSRLPKIVVDMGAVPYVCKGADIMAPGVVRIEGEFSKRDLVLVLDEKHGKMLALCETLYDAQEARNTKKGAVAKSLHFVSDKIWDYAKTLTE
jgi:PUA-domain protein